MASVDLTINELYLSPEIVRPRDVFAIDYSLYNYSTEVPDGNIKIDFYLSEDATIDDRDYFLESATIVPDNNFATNWTLFYTTQTSLPDANNSFWNGSGDYYIGGIVTPSSLDTEVDVSDNNTIRLDATGGFLVSIDLDRDSDIIASDEDGGDVDGATGNGSGNNSSFPDLTGSILEIDELSLVPGGTFNIDFSLLNNSSVNANSFDVDFYLYNNNTQSNILLESYLVNGLSGNSRLNNLSTTLTLPNANNNFWNNSGDYSIAMVVDGENIVRELDNDNNIFFRRVNVDRFADLTGNISSINNIFDRNSRALNPGERFTVDFNLFNDTSVRANSFDVDFYLYNDDTDDNLFLGSYDVNRLNGNSRLVDLSKTLTLPEINNGFWDSDGDYFIRMVIDPDNSVGEINNNNNTDFSREFDVIYPDLSARVLNTNPESIKPGNNLTVDFNLSNNTNTDADPFNVGFYLYNSNTEDNLFLDNLQINGLNGNTQQNNLNKSLTLPQLNNEFWKSDGNYFIRIIADTNNSILESDRNNNSTLSQELEIDIRPDIVNNYFNITTEPLNPGSNFNVDFTISNNTIIPAGSFDIDFYISQDEIITKEDRYLNSYNISSLDRNTISDRLTKNLTLPQKNDPFWNESGNYYIGSIVDPDNTVNEENENNNSNSGFLKDYDDTIVSLNPKNTRSTDDVNTPIYRFQNSDRPGTYLFVGETERQNIKQNFSNFKEEGLAFKVGIEPGDDLLPLYRFQNIDRPGTYLFIGESERQSLNNSQFANDFIEEGLAFYVYRSDYDLGNILYRFNNSDSPGTYLYVGSEERDNIKANFPNFIEEGEAFGVEI